MKQVMVLIVAVLWLLPATANQLRLEQLTSDVYAIVGPLTNRTPENLGNNATFGFIVTNEGVVLIDSGGSYLGAKAIHEVIKGITQQPVKYVINTGGQDHRWFGNDYFSRQGATIISSTAARADHEKRLVDQVLRLTTLIGDDKYQGTREKYADQLFEQEMQLKVGGIDIHIVHAGQAHTPGDAFVWLPQQKIMFSGDIVYVERMLGVGEQSHSGSWIKAFETMAGFAPDILVPGHGNPGPLEVARKDTYQYLVDLRQRVGDFLDEGGDASEISQVDMSDYAYLFNYDTLAGRNALKVFTEMEWE